MWGHVKRVLEGVFVYAVVMKGIFEWLDRMKWSESLPRGVVPLFWVVGPIVMAVVSLLIRPIPRTTATASILEHVWAEARCLVVTFVILAAVWLAGLGKPGPKGPGGEISHHPVSAPAPPAPVPPPGPPPPDPDSVLESHFTGSTYPLAFVDSGSVQALRMRDWHGHVLTVLRYGRGRFFLAGKDLVRGVALPDVTGQQLEAMVTRFRSTLMDHATASLRSALASGTARVTPHGPDRYEVVWGTFTFLAGCAMDGDLLDELTMWENDVLKLELNGRSPAGDRSFIGTEGLASALRHAAY